MLRDPHSTVSGLRLPVGILLGMLLLISVGAVGLVGMSKVERRLEAVTRIHNAESRQAREMHSATFEMSRLIRDLVLITDEPGMRRLYSAFQDAQSNYQRHEAKLAGMFADPAAPASAEERELFDQIKALKELAEPPMMHVAELGLKNSNVEATRVLMDETQPKIAAWMQALGELVDLEDQINDESTADAAEAYASARMLIIGLGALALLCAVAVVWWLSRAGSRGTLIERPCVQPSADPAGASESAKQG